jgi:hypothetical protein
MFDFAFPQFVQKKSFNPCLFGMTCAASLLPPTFIVPEGNIHRPSAAFNRAPQSQNLTFAAAKQTPFSSYASDYDRRFPHRGAARR